MKPHRIAVSAAEREAVVRRYVDREIAPGTAIVTSSKRSDVSAAFPIDATPSLKANTGAR